jgi:hypothetical protein
MRWRKNIFILFYLFIFKDQIYNNITPKKKKNTNLVQSFLTFFLRPLIINFSSKSQKWPDKFEGK